MKQNNILEKTNESIISLQEKLVPIVSEMWESKKICFNSVKVKPAPGGYFWKPLEALGGKYIWESFNNSPDLVIETSRKIAEDYQKVISEYFKRNPDKKGNLFDEGRNWLFGKLMMWSGSIIEEGLIGHEEITKLVREFENVVQKKGENYFDYFHGNVIGDHIYIGEDKTLYLLGMRIVPRPGKGQYDFLRTLDWFYLKTPDEEQNFNRTIEWMKKYLGQYDWEEVKLTFALRCIGLLGWDILYRGDLGAGELNNKKKFLMKFIRREY